MEKLLDLSLSPMPSNINVGKPCDLLTGSPEFLMPQVPKPHGSESQDSFSFQSTSFDFDLTKESAPITGRPSLFIDDGRESLGILPQFKGRIGLKSHLSHVLENPDSFLVCAGNEEENDGTTAEALDLLPKDEDNYFLDEFERDCKEIETDRSQCDVKDVTDENYSMYVEANFLASKMADNSILDISQEAGSILDKTPQPELVEEDSISKEKEIDQKVDTDAVHKQLDKMLPPEIKNAINPSEPMIESASSLNVKNIFDMLILVNKQHNHSEVRSILNNTIKLLSELCEREERNSVDEEDSGHSSTENEKEQRDGYGVLDLSLKASSTDHMQALDLSFKETVPRRMSITFSHKDDPALPHKQPSNNLKQQTMHMKQLWGGRSVASSEGSIMSACSNESSKVSNPSSSTGSIKGKLKPKKGGEPEIIKKGPLKAVVPLTSLNTSLTFDQPVGLFAKGRQRTPKTAPRPVAQSTPEEFSAFGKKKMQYPISPLARTTARTTPNANRTNRLIDLNRSDSLPDASMETKQLKEKTNVNGASMKMMALGRRRSAADLKQPPAETALGKSKLTTLRRSYSVTGKENMLQGKQISSSPSTKANHQSLIRPPQKNIAMKPFNLVEKIKKGK